MVTTLELMAWLAIVGVVSSVVTGSWAYTLGYRGGYREGKSMGAATESLRRWAKRGTLVATTINPRRSHPLSGTVTVKDILKKTGQSEPE